MSLRAAALVLAALPLAACLEAPREAEGGPAAPRDRPDVRLLETPVGPRVFAVGPTVGEAAIRTLSFCGIVPDTTPIDILSETGEAVEGSLGVWSFAPPPGCGPG
ncbi:hypothetical protein [Wenxinia saemankumensis]|uniref:Uncharacterized protein n=1 Tax=Wenxinia saemankumensis TaxID=1447782 RepID=A0A1M6HEE4_9RHOB|nr:hypothetical protein [Wenxinia saemankumensis]SHJ20516.1 hypothetical protein SAMN05444417_3187 [Wenxinia saemankumensis]